jgi:GxxExxY protein
METIKSFARHVFETLGAGFSEKVYHNALQVMLKNNNISFISEHSIPVKFEGVDIGQVRADLIVNGNLVVELKSVKSIRDDHTTQCGMYMKLLNIKNGLVINFPCSDEEDVDFQPIVLTTPPPVHEGNCDRCGRNNHDASSCYAKKHLSGYFLV